MRSLDTLCCNSGSQKAETEWSTFEVLIPALGRQGQADLYDFEASLVCRSEF